LLRDDEGDAGSHAGNGVALGEWTSATKPTAPLIGCTPTKQHPNEHEETQTFDESDYARIPPADLPVGLPSRFGDDHWGRTANPRHNNSVERPSDDDHTLIWKPPTPSPDNRAADPTATTARPAHPTRCTQRAPHPARRFRGRIHDSSAMRSPPIRQAPTVAPQPADEAAHRRRIR